MRETDRALMSEIVLIDGNWRSDPCANYSVFLLPTKNLPGVHLAVYSTENEPTVGSLFNYHDVAAWLLSVVQVWQ
jgi:hypothetical protein